MARDSVVPTDLSVGVVTTTPAGVAINPTNGANIPSPGPFRKLSVRVTNTAGASHIVTFRAGTYPGSMGAALGDLVVTVPATTGDVVLQLDGSRHVQADGSINVDFETGMTGFISVLRRSRYA